MTYTCFRNPAKHLHIVLRTADQETAEYTAKALLAGHVVEVLPAPDRPVIAALATGLTGALSICASLFLASGGPQ